MAEMFNPISIALHMLNATILGTAMYFLLYRPVRAFMLKRQNAVQSQIDDAASMRAKAAELQRGSERLIEDAQRKAAETIAQSAETAERRAAEIIERAQGEIKRARASAEADIEKMRVQAQEALRDQAADLAVQMAETLIGRGITSEDHTRLVGALIERL
ncbi:MAG: F0F1 ATP synthase subunit B [Oscillospiraceae bacterium]|jgi:F-type H+-transporting ATPase subunit b|nr:F0F1 ATP synthase subunit B [Oscillospiraceae bacterium]